METMNLYQKINAISNDLGVIEKSGKNTMQNYNFMEQAEIMAKIRPLLEKHGLAIIPETIERRVFEREVTRSNGKQGIDTHVQTNHKYTIVNTDKPDERIECLWDGGEAIDSGDKATNKAITASQKYFYIKLFHISDKEDPDLDSPSEANKAEAKPVKPVVKTDNKANEGQLNAIRNLSSKIALAIDETKLSKMTFDEAGQEITRLQQFTSEEK